MSGGSGEGALRVRWKGEDLDLLPQRALFWPRGGILFLADLHLGKSAVFRAGGIPIPDGPEGTDLARLSQLVTRLAPREVVLLGDLIHGREGWTPELGAALRATVGREREEDRSPEWTLVRGNHDLHGGGPPAGVGIREVREGLCRGPFRLFHHPPSPGAGEGRTLRAPPLGPPAEPAADPPVLAGHLHPVIRLRGPGDQVRLPCFVLGPRVGILPAFGSFTGGSAVSRRADVRIFAAYPGGVVELPRGGEGSLPPAGSGSGAGER